MLRDVDKKLRDTFFREIYFFFKISSSVMRSGNMINMESPSTPRRSSLKKLFLNIQKF